MLSVPSQLLEAARAAGMRVPPHGVLYAAMGRQFMVDVDTGFDVNEYPHFAVFCSVQLWRDTNGRSHWENAKVVAEIPLRRVWQVDLKALMREGLEYV